MSWRRVYTKSQKQCWKNTANVRLDLDPYVFQKNVILAAFQICLPFEEKEVECWNVVAGGSSQGSRTPVWTRSPTVWRGWSPGCSPTPWPSGRWSGRTHPRGRRTSHSRSTSSEPTLLRWAFIFEYCSEACRSTMLTTLMQSGSMTSYSLCSIVCLFLDQTLNCRRSFPSPWPTTCGSVPQAHNSPFPEQSTFYFHPDTCQMLRIPLSPSFAFL